jgi:hypothetical protein
MTVGGKNMVVVESALGTFSLSKTKGFYLAADTPGP